MELRGQRVSAEQLYHRLVKSINKVYNDVVNGEGFIDQVKHPEEFELFDNPFRVVDGPWYVCTRRFVCPHFCRIGSHKSFHFIATHFWYMALALQWEARE